MYDVHSRSGVSYGSGFFILLGMIGLGLFFGSLLAGGVWVMMTGNSIFTMEKDMMNPQFSNAIKALQLVSTFFIFFIPAMVTAMIMSRKPFRFLGFNLYFSQKQAGITILIMLCSLPLVGALSEINKLIPIPHNWEVVFKKMEDSYAQQVKVLAEIRGWGEYFIALIIMGLAPAIFEETLFRGAMQNILQKVTNNPWISIGVTSIIFSAIHFSYYGFIPRVALGVILGLIFYYSGSIWLSILAHFFNNALVVSQIFYLTQKGKPIEDAMNDSSPVWWGIPALLALVFLFRFFRKFALQDLKSKKPAEDIALEEKWMT
jgi:uncharacterized protein